MIARVRDDCVLAFPQVSGMAFMRRLGTCKVGPLLSILGANEPGTQSWRFLDTWRFLGENYVPRKYIFAFGTKCLHAAMRDPQ